MDRALDLGLLAGALEGAINLPAPAELRQMLAEAEIGAFFARRESLDPVLLETAWNLHHIGTTRRALELYGLERQVQANSVAAHIFDVALRDNTLQPGKRLVITFAAQVSAIRGDRTPNATALGRRLPEPSARFSTDPGRASLEVGCAFLTFDRGRLVPLLRSLIAEQRERGDTRGTSLASASGVLDGTQALQRYMTYGDGGALDEARQAFATAANAPSAMRDLDSRWVAAHLLDLCDDFGRSSVWATLPLDTPPAVGRSMTLGDPPVMTLWPPQVRLLSDGEASPFRPEVRRAVLTFPTSAGKTLLTQLLIAQHLATVGTGVCFVAPSHSLCREVRGGLDRRLWVLRKNIREDGPLGDPALVAAPVVVMTPERLAARLRADEQALLDAFGLFVFDEAHILTDPTRGWAFETTISRLHCLTESTDHRLVLVSAALGGTTSIRTWLDLDEVDSNATSTWRGPRRLHATYIPTEGSPSRVEPPTGKQKLARRVTDLKGVVSLYVDQGAAVSVRAAQLGEVVRAGKSKSAPSRAEQLSPIVELAARSGSVLTIHATKPGAERLAATLASHRVDCPESLPLVRLAELRLGNGHPLVSILRKGVAYHHAALPADLQAEIEEAVRSEAIQIVCATSTLIEGINLPVRSVIVCERGFYDGTEFNEFISAADLLNAAGRAGRAGRETEGWVIVAQEPWGTHPRQALLGLDQSLEIRSTLNTQSALADLAAYEALVHDTAGLVLEAVPATVDGFLGYCWYLAEVSQALDPRARQDKVIAGLQETLAWHQLPENVRYRWESLAARVAEAHEAAEPVKRARWAQSGAYLSANAVLDEVAQSAASELATLHDFEHAAPIKVLELLLNNGRLERLLTLVPDRDRRFKRRRYGATDPVDVDVGSLILNWVRGMDLAELVRVHLAGVDSTDDEGFPFEQLSVFLTRVCEHHLPWTLGTILGWLNAGRERELCPALPAHLHFGVAESVSLELMKRGVRSRRLAATIGEAAEAQGIGTTELRNWLVEKGANEWRSEFRAGPTEVADLLQFLHDPFAAVGARLLDGGGVELSVDPHAAPWGPHEELSVRYLATDERPPLLGIVTGGGEVTAAIRTAEHRDLSVLLDAGFELLARRTSPEDAPTSSVRLRVDLD